MSENLRLLVLGLFSLSASAQSNKEEIEILQGAFGREKKAVTAEFIKLEGQANDAFWLNYDEILINHFLFFNP